MHITVAAVGRTRAGPMGALFEDYARRLSHGPLGPIELKEVEEHRPLSPPEMKRREAALLLAAVPRGARLVALDARGRSLSSEDFAALLGRWRDEGAAHAAFLIGGPEGLDETARQAATATLSLGPMTWPHLLVRVLLAEQLFRAQSILTGHPYHRS